jgi:hypothetical protein
MNYNERVGDKQGVKWEECCLFFWATVIVSRSVACHNAMKRLESCETVLAAPPSPMHHHHHHTITSLISLSDEFDFCSVTPGED